MPIAGDWNGDGRTDEGLYSRGGVFGTTGSGPINFGGEPGDIPITGD